MNTNAWQTERIRLRGLEPSDSETFFAWNRDDTEANRSIDYLWFPGSREASRQWAQSESLKRGDNDQYFFVIETLPGVIVGTINSHSCDLRNGTFAYGVAIIAAHQRQGYASEAIILLLRHFFDERRYQKCTVTVYGFNTSSIHLHERLGFTLEGRLRRMIYSNGQHHDLLYYGITAPEFASKFPKHVSPF